MTREECVLQPGAEGPPLPCASGCAPGVLKNVGRTNAENTKGARRSESTANEYCGSARRCIFSSHNRSTSTAESLSRVQRRKAPEPIFEGFSVRARLAFRTRTSRHSRPRARPSRRPLTRRHRATPAFDSSHTMAFTIASNVAAKAAAAPGRRVAPKRSVAARAGKGFEMPGQYKKVRLSSVLRSRGSSLLRIEKASLGVAATRPNALLCR